MKRFSKISLQATLLMGLTLPTSASAGVLSKLEAQCQCLTEQATLGQVISLGVMLALVTGIILVKWIYRKELQASELSKQSEADDPAVQTLRQLKIGTRFSDWSHVHRITNQKQPI